MNKMVLPLFAVILQSFFTYGEGTKEMCPDSMYRCALRVSNGGGGYSCFATAFCSPDEKLYVRITHPGEKIFMGFNGASIPPLVVTIRFEGNIVYSIGPLTQTPGTPGYIQYYSQAVFGPDILGARGYPSISYVPPSPGDYDIEFTVGTIIMYDITVIDTTVMPLHPTLGRLWSQSWAFDSGSISAPAGRCYARQYILTDDSIVTSLYYNGMQGHLFDVACNRNGCYPPPAHWDSSCMSRSGGHRYPEYKIFLNNPDPVDFPTGVFGAIVSGSFNVIPNCDGTMTISFVANKAGDAKVYVEINQVPGLQTEDVTLFNKVLPGINTMTWNGLNGAGLPVPSGNTVSIYMEYINGLTNYPVFDVEQHYDGFIIELVRPLGPPIATYWNDTLLASKGGRRQLNGCFATYPSNGCHKWTGNYGGVGLGSLNTVNTWWYAASSKTSEIPLVMKRYPPAPETMTGPAQLCQSATGTYSITSLPGSDITGYEWVLTEAATGAILLDTVTTDTSLVINFVNFPTGNLILRVRGQNDSCGFGPYGPGPNGEGYLISVLPAPVITNTVFNSSVCSGETINILLLSSIPTATWQYTANASSPAISGYSAGFQNPIVQTLVNGWATIDTVFYHVSASADGCISQAREFTVTVSPPPVITNQQTSSTICSGENTQIVLSSNLPGTLFHWTATLVSGNVSGFSPDSGFIINQALNNPGPGNGMVIYHVIPKAGTCSGDAKDFQVTVTPGVPVTLTIVSSANNICSGTPVTFTATPGNGGMTPVYQWKVNGLNAGTGGPIFSYVPMAGDQVSCMLTSSNTSCIANNPATSNIIPMIVNPLLPVTVAIATPSNPVCTGTPVTFTATAANGGSAPQYHWMVNGAVAGSNNPVFTYTPLHGDVVTCLLTSNAACQTGSPATSNPVIMSVNSALPVGVLIGSSYNPFCPGSQVTFNATVANGGNAPQYQWCVNANNITSATNSTFSYSPANGDVVSCSILSNLSCVTGNPASSNAIQMVAAPIPDIRFVTCFDSVTTVNARPFKLKGGIPFGGTFSGPGVNPATSTFTPSDAGTGLKTISYSYTNVSQCTATKTRTILVQLNAPFACGSTLTDIRDGETYPTVLIGSQCWMASNLGYGTTIADLTPQTDNCIPERYVHPSFVNPVQSSFYQWDEVMQYDDTPATQGLCPPGWHIPSEADWMTLTNHYLGNGRAGRPLQDSTINGFHALPSGFLYLNSTFSFDSFGTTFWSSVAYGPTRAVAHGVNKINYSVSLYPASRGNGFAVRCLQD